MRVISDRFIVDQSAKAVEGGMADVLRAYDTEQSMAPIAVKLFKEGIASETYILEAFSRECQSLNELGNHPHIIKQLDFGTDNETGRKFIALEWMPRTLPEYLAAQPLKGWDDFYERVGKPILSAVAFAYSRDILHRDIKPTNILISEDEVVKVADFGISKVRRFYRPGITLKDFRSAPYAPEIENEEFADRRDVYSYGVLCLECLRGSPFDSYDQVYAYLNDEADILPEIEKILRTALEREPERRQSNILVLQDDLESFQRERRAYWKQRDQKTCYVHVTQTVCETFRQLKHCAHTDAAVAAVLEDINEHCAIDEWYSAAEPGDDGGERDYALYGAEFRYRAKVDDSRTRIILRSATRLLPNVIETRRERAWNPHLRFKLVQKTPDNAAQEVINWIADGFQDFLSQREQARLVRKEAELFERWANLLRFKTDQEVNKEAPVRYNGCETDGRRIKLYVDGADQALVDQPRIIRRADHTTIKGIVEAVRVDSVTLYCEDEISRENIPTRGELVFDNGLAKLSIDRQNAALDAVRFDRAARADLRKILVGSQPARKPRQIEAINFFSEKLDKDKQDAVKLALGSSDIVVVEGPPGTGKTRFITELTLQFIRSNPSARVLISSQTHNAVDNAIEAISKIAAASGLDPKIVRIGHRDDQRISKLVAPLLLDKIVDAWLKEAAQRSDQFLERWASRHNIDLNEIRLAMAIANCRITNARASLLDSAAKRLEEQKKSLESQLDRKNVAPTDHIGFEELNAQLKLVERDSSQNLDDLQRARRDQKKALEQLHAHPGSDPGLDGLNEAELREWEQLYLTASPQGPQLKALVDLLEEWKLQFGRTEDFKSAFIGGCDIVAGTCIGFNGRWMQNIQFDLCIVDEASKATPTEILIPLSRSKRWVVVGDPNQLPPYIDGASEAQDGLAKYGLTRESLKQTLLDHLLSIVPQHSRKMLTQQHRMVKPIGDLISRCFYEGKLVSVNEETDPNLIRSQALRRPVTWYSTSAVRDCHEQSVNGQYVNLTEVAAIESVLLRLQFAAEASKTVYSVALMSGYAGQVKELERLKLRLSDRVKALDIQAATVDAYQGREADVSIYSVTRSNLHRRIGFLKERERLNVALSRGRLGLVVVGDASFCESIVTENPFRAVLDYIRNNPETCALQEVGQ